jgi:hypothetical protein
MDITVTGQDGQTYEISGVPDNLGQEQINTIVQRNFQGATWQPMQGAQTPVTPQSGQPPLSALGGGIKPAPMPTAETMLNQGRQQSGAPLYQQPMAQPQPTQPTQPQSQAKPILPQFPTKMPAQARPQPPGGRSYLDPYSYIDPVTKQPDYEAINDLLVTYPEAGKKINTDVAQIMKTQATQGQRAFEREKREIPTDAVRTSRQKLMDESSLLLMQLNSTKEAYIPMYQTFGGKGVAWWSQLKDKADTNTLSDDEREFLAGISIFRRRSSQILNVILAKEAGANVTDQEKTRWINTIPDIGTGPFMGLFDGDSPTVYEAKLDDFIDMTQKIIARTRYADATGQDWEKIRIDDMPNIMKKEWESLVVQVRAELNSKYSGVVTNEQIRNEVLPRFKSMFGYSEQ